MTVRLEATIKRFRGSSADAKPLTDIPAGSSFRETDTRTLWVFNGTSWDLVDIDTTAQAQQATILLTEIRDELSRIRLGQEVLTGASLALRDA